MINSSPRQFSLPHDNEVNTVLQYLVVREWRQCESRRSSGGADEASNVATGVTEYNGND